MASGRPPHALNFFSTPFFTNGADRRVNEEWIWANASSGEPIVKGTPQHEENATQNFELEVDTRNGPNAVAYAHTPYSSQFVTNRGEEINSNYFTGVPVQRNHANGPMQQGTLGLGHSVPSLPSTTGVEFRSNKTPMRTCVSNIGQPISTLRTFGYWHARLPQLQPFQIPVAVPSMIYNGSNAPAAFNTTSPVGINPVWQSPEWKLMSYELNQLQVTPMQAPSKSVMDAYEFCEEEPGEPQAKSPLDPTFPPVSRYIAEDFERNILRTPRSQVLRACGQCSSIPIQLIFSSLDGVYKVNEGVFGEVYGGTFNGGEDASVYKLVPIEGTEKVNDENQKRYEEIETEIRVSQRLNTLWNPQGRNYTEGFCYLYHARLLHGSYPSILLRAWRDWHAKNRSDNDLPNFSEAQLYVVFEYEHCGKDVESFNFRTAEQAYSVLLQVAFTLAVAECQLRFEHRDLHWGNILVTQAKERFIYFRVNGYDYQVPSIGLKTSIIDFTMARCDDENGDPIFDDLKDDEIQFTGTSDYQFEIYRMMRRENSNRWNEFHPKSNIFWLHYLADKFLTRASYSGARGSTTHANCINYLKVFKDQILGMNSCTDFVKNQKQYLKPLSPGGSERRV